MLLLYHSPVEDKYKDLLKKLNPFVVCTKDNFKELLNLDPEITNLKFYDSLDTRNTDFFKRILELDEKCFDEAGMGMPRWVFFDCAIMPGVVFGFGIESRQLSSQDREFLKIKTECFYPLSMYAALPDSQNNWFGHNLCSLNSKLQISLAGLGFLTKMFAMKLIKAHKIRGATQWNSKALNLHLKFGPVKLLSAYTPIHSNPETLCYEYTQKLNLDFLKVELTETTMLELQRKIESGRDLILSKKEKEFIWIAEN